MKLDWTIRPGSRISRIGPRPLQFVLLFIRNAWGCLVRLRPKNEFEHVIDRSYVESVKYALAYVIAAEVDGSVGEFGCHGILAKTVARWLARFSPERSYYIPDISKSRCRRRRSRRGSA